MIQYPITFKGKAQSVSGIDSLWESHASQSGHLCCVPKEFEGPGGGSSPEDFYLLALMNCFVATFKVYAHHSKLKFEKLTIESELIVDTEENKKVTMKSCLLRVSIVKASNVELCKRLLQRTFESGFILNSVKTKLDLVVEVT